MSWIVTASGRRIDPLDPDPDQIIISDIAHALSNICRFNGHTMRHYSVAEHSTLVARHLLATGADPKIAFAGLMHDAAEAYMSDLTTPIKQRMPSYHVFEEGLLLTIAEKFGFQFPIPEEVKFVDKAATLWEGRVMMHQDVTDWDGYSKQHDIDFSPQYGYSLHDIKAGFLSTFDHLRALA